MHSNVTSKNVSGFTLAGPPCTYIHTYIHCLTMSVCLTSVCPLHTSGITRTERPRKTKIGTEVAHVTRDSDTTFQGQKVKGQGHVRGGAYRGIRPPTACFFQQAYLAQQACEMTIRQ